MNVLVACEESQRVCIEFRRKGHNAFSCDIQECSGGHPEWHIIADVINFLNPQLYELDLFYGIRFYTMDNKFHEIKGKWDLIIAHPPCTYLSKAGARWLYQNNQLNQKRFENGLIAKTFFEMIYATNCEKICIENPTPLKIYELPKATQIIQPYEFGELYSKRTCLWLKGLPQLRPTTPSNKPIGTWTPSNCSLHTKGKAGNVGIAHSQKERSKTFIGIAKAMAEQWG